MKESLPWSDPNSKPLDDVRRTWIQMVGAENIRATGSWGCVWFNINGVPMDIEEGLKKYGK